MTLEEMGQDYIRQSEDIWIRIQTIEQRILAGDNPYSDYEQAAKELNTLYDMFNEMRTIGERLVHYYDK